MTAVEAPPRPRARPAAVGTPYELLSPAERYIHETRDRALLALLQRHGCGSLAGLRILEIGCGEGSLLRTLIHHGAEPHLLDGIDVDARKVARARRSLRDARLAVADGALLPYAGGALDVAFAFTTFSSMLDAGVRRRAAREAVRVLRAGGLLVVYDFWANPLNSRVRPVRAAELRALFAPRRVEIERVTLAPPIVRALGGRPALCRPLERLPFLRTHLLAAVVKES